VHFVVTSTFKVFLAIDFSPEIRFLELTSTGALFYFQGCFWGHVVQIFVASIRNCSMILNFLNFE